MIRKAFEQDIPAIQAVAHTSWEHTYEGIMRPETRSQFLEEFYSYEALSRALTLPRGGIWVAEPDGTITGFLQVVPMLNKPGLELTRLYVLPEKKRQGIGGQLLAMVLSRYVDTPIWALVERDDESAMRFYHKNGFKLKRELSLNLFGEDLAFVEFYLANNSRG